MGSGSSKPDEHVFNADAPVRFSQSIVDSLQNSPETDSTRAQDVELKVQSRVNAELKRIRDAESKRLSDITASLSANPAQEGAESSGSQRKPNSLFAHLSSPFYRGGSASGVSSSEPREESDRSHDSVQKEIMDLRQKLESRKKLEKVNPEVEKRRRIW